MMTKYAGGGDEGSQWLLKWGLGWGLRSCQFRDEKDVIIIGISLGM